MPICKKCGNNFSNRITIDNINRVINKRVYCLECSPFNMHNTRQVHLPTRKKHDNQHVWQKKARIERKQELLDFRGGKCRICNYSTYTGALDFHHVKESDKRFILSKSILTCKSMEELKVEAKKTIILCRNCHAEVHAGLHEVEQNIWYNEIYGNIDF